MKASPSTHGEDFETMDVGALVREANIWCRYAVPAAWVAVKNKLDTLSIIWASTHAKSR
jgi:hypothetical protein